MTAANVPNEILNLTPADAVPVNANFQYLEAFLNAEMINRDGSTAMTQPLTLPGAPTQTLQAANKGYVDAILPVGMIMPYAGETAPAGDWLLCRGQSLSTSEYPTLFAVLGYRYGGAGSSFNLPDLRARFPIGCDPAVSAVDATGKTGGTIVVPISQHSHTMAHTHSINHDHGAVTTGNQSANHTHAFGTTTSTQGTHGHDLSQLAAFGGGGGLAALVYPGAPGSTRINGTFADGSHAHTVSGTTAGNNVSHNHSVDLPSFSGTSGASSAASTANAGTAGAEMRPPFQVVNYIIRTR